MNIPLPPMEMDHSHISTIHLTTISLSMFVSDMMPPKHLHPLRGEMFMQLLVLRISTLLKTPTTHFFQDIDTTPDDFYQVHQTKHSRKPPHHYLASRKITPESLPLLHPKNHLRNTMDLYMSLLRFINSSVLKQLLPSSNIILRLSIKCLRKGVSMSLMSLMSLIMNYLLLRLISLMNRLTLTKMMMHLKIKLIPF